MGRGEIESSLREISASEIGLRFHIAGIHRGSAFEMADRVFHPILRCECLAAEVVQIYRLVDCQSFLAVLLCIGKTVLSHHRAAEISIGVCEIRTQFGGFLEVRNGLNHESLSSKRDAQVILRIGK